MTDATHILSQINDGDPSAADQFLPLMHDELRKLAAAKLAQEKPGQTLQATALLHEAYLPLADVERECCWLGRGSFGVGPHARSTSRLYHFDGAVLPDFANLVNQIDGAEVWATDAGCVYPATLEESPLARLNSQLVE